MTSNVTCSLDEQNSIIEAYAHGLGTIYLYVMTPTILGSLLIPFLIALLYCSNTHQRRTPMFLLVVLAVVTGLAQSVMQATIHMRMLYNPVNTTAKVFTHPIITSALVLELLPNWIADLALLYRIMAVYPRATTPRWQYFLILTPPIIFKAVRVACWIGFDIALTRPHGELEHFKWTLEERHWTVVERSFTALDNSYATMFFLLKLRGVYRFNDDVIGPVGSLGSLNTLGDRISALFWFSVTNFVLPVPLCFIEIILAAVLPNSIAYEILQHWVNFISVVCVAFSTIWYSGFTFGDVRHATPPMPSSLHFRRSFAARRSSPDADWESADGLVLDPPQFIQTLPEKRSTESVHVDWARQTTV